MTDRTAPMQRAIDAAARELAKERCPGGTGTPNRVDQWYARIALTAAYPHLVGAAMERQVIQSGKYPHLTDAVLQENCSLREAACEWRDIAEELADALRGVFPGNPRTRIEGIDAALVRYDEMITRERTK